MSDVNKVFLMGRLTRDPELRYMPKGAPVASFGVATNRVFTGSDGQRKEDATFVDIDAFGKTAELCSQYLTKGRQVFIEGRLKYRAWESQDGQKRNKLTVVAERVTFIGGRGEGQARPAAGDGPAESAETKDEPKFAPDEDEIPF
jgi:single-strand DNA-binding protein